MDRSQQQQKERPASERRILVVEDEGDLRRLLVLLLERDGWSVQKAGDGLSALQILEVERFVAVLSDDRLPGPQGIRVLEHARLLNPDARLVLFGGWLSQESRERARAISAATVTKGATESLALLLTVLNET